MVSKTGYTVEYIIHTYPVHVIFMQSTQCIIACTGPSPPRDLTITRVFQQGIELNWLPPRETNGDIQHYIIKYTTQDGTEQEISTTDNTNYYNLTGLERGQTYNIKMVAVNSAGTSEESVTITSYIHNTTDSINTTTPSK